MPTFEALYGAQGRYQSISKAPKGRYAEQIDQLRLRQGRKHLLAKRTVRPQVFQSNHPQVKIFIVKLISHYQDVPTLICTQQVVSLGQVTQDLELDSQKSPAAVEHLADLVNISTTPNEPVYSHLGTYSFKEWSSSDSVWLEKAHVPPRHTRGGASRKFKSRDHNPALRQPRCLGTAVPMTIAATR